MRNSAFRQVVERWRQRDDRADVEVGVRPAVEPRANALDQGIVDGGVAQRAGDADTGQLPRFIDPSPDADNGVQAEELDGDCGVLQVEVVRANRGYHRRRECRDVNLQTDPERRFWIDRGDRLVHAQHISPELLVAERVEPEDQLARLHSQLIHVFRYRRGLGDAGGAGFAAYRQGQGEREYE